MASSSEEEPVHHEDDPIVIHDSQQYSDDNDHAPQAEYHRYHEVNTTQQVPTKTGDEDEMHPGSDRPGSAGTGRSVPLEDEDQAFLTANAASSKPAEVAAEPVKTQKLSRPTEPTDSGSSGHFAFGQHKQPSMDFQGTRRGPSSQTQGIPEHGSHQDVHVPSTAGDIINPSVGLVENPQLQPYQHDQAPTGTQPNLPQRGNDPPIRPKKKSKEGKKRKSSKRHLVALRQEQDQALIHTAPVEASSADFEASHAEPTEGPIYGPVQDPAPSFEAGRPATPVPEQSHESLVVDPGSPQVQPQQQHDMEPMQRSSHSTATHVPAASAPLRQRQPSTLPMTSASQPQPAQGFQTTTPGFGTQPSAKRGATAMGTGRPKKKSKTSRNGTAAVQSGQVADSDIGDFLQILMYKIRQQSQNSLNQVAAERDYVQQELQQVLEARQTLEAELNRALQENHNLSTKFEKEKTKLSAQERNVNKFKTFLSGLGKDVDALKKDANATHHKGEELLEAGQKYTKAREVLVNRMQNCAERSSELQNKAVKVCSDLQSALHEAEQKASYLEKQLNEKVGLLTEERDRRTKLENRFLSAPDSTEILRVMKENSTALLDKLYLLHAALESDQTSSNADELLGKTHDAVQTLAAKTSTSAEDAVTMKGVLEALSDRFTELEGQASVQPLKTQLDEVLAGLKDIADHQEDRIRQDAAHSEAINGFQEKLKGSNARIAQTEDELNTAKDREATLKEDNQKLQSKITTLQSQPASTGDAQIQLDEARSEVAEKIRALEAAKSDLSSKTSELDTLREKNEELQTAMQSLRDTVQELEQATANLTPEKMAIEQEIRDKVERATTELRKSTEDWKADLEMQSSNQIRKLTSDRDRYEKQVTPLKAELANTKKLVEELQKQATEGTGNSHQLEQMKKLAQTQVKEVETLKSSLKELQQAADVDKALGEKLQGLQADLEAEKAKARDAVQQRSTSQKQANEYQHDATEARKACEQAKAELATHRANTDSQLEKKTKEVQAAQEATQHAEAGKEHFKKTCDSAIEKEKATGRRQIEDLQTSLAQAQAELDQEKSKVEEFCVQSEEQWETRETQHAQRVDELRSQIAEAETARDEARANHERSLDERRSLSEEVEELKQRAAAAEEKLQAQEEALSQGITPSGNANPTAPTRPRKKVDRNQGATVNPAPKISPELRPDSRKAEPAQVKQATRGPVVEESQFDEVQPLAPDSGEVVHSQSAHFPMFSDHDEMPDVLEDDASQHPTERIAETQYENTRSISAFDRSISGSQTARQGRPSPSLSMLYPPQSSRPVGAERGVASQDFSILEETENTQPTQAERYLQDTLNWSQAERDSNTYRKTFPHPNSASKLVRNDSQSSAGGGSRMGDSQYRVPLAERRLHTPEFTGEVARSSQRSAGQSSSPAYTQATSSRPARTYSNAPGASNKRRTSTTQAASGQDPRLAGRNPTPAPKRKADNIIAEGYEQERKKRLSSNANTSSSGAPRFDLRSNSQHTVNGLPSVPRTANPRGTSSQSRVRNLGGSSARAPASRRIARAHEIDSRFSQELR